ncbi:hypothetical protein [Klebsiella pneumoniae]|uniref:hypothetical protein n=1 Tax=Klebsiella pneumoniae TaxID=573 RepID=UPI003AD01AE8
MREFNMNGPISIPAPRLVNGSGEIVCQEEKPGVLLGSTLKNRNRAAGGKNKRTGQQVEMKASRTVNEKDSCLSPDSSAEIMLKLLHALTDIKTIAHKKSPTITDNPCHFLDLIGDIAGEAIKQSVALLEDDIKKSQSSGYTQKKTLRNPPQLNFSLPVSESLTGQILANIENGKATGSFPLRPNEFVGSVDSFTECCRLAGFQITMPR